MFLFASPKKTTLIFIFSIFISCSCAFAQDLKQGLIACYNFSGNANDAITGRAGIVSGATLTTDRHDCPNNAYLFDGSTNRIQLPLGNITFNDSYTFSVWAYPMSLPASGNAGWVYTLGPSNGGGDHGVMLNNNYFGNTGWGGYGYDISPGALSNTAAYSEILPTIRNWYHVVMTRQRGVTKLYINGKLTKTSPNSGKNPEFGPLLRMFIGSRGSQQYFHGKIDDVTLFNRPLNDNEVAQLYKSLPCAETPVVKLEELPVNICAGQKLTVPFQSACNFLPGTVFGLQLSDVNGVNFNDVPISSTSSPLVFEIPANIPQGRYRVRVIVKEDNIISQPSNEFTISTQPTATISENSTIDKGQSAILKIELTGTSPWQLQLSDGSVLKNLTTSPVYHSVTPSISTTYTIQKIENGSCEGTPNGVATVTIRDVVITNPGDSDGIWVPSVFSPNEDGINDRFGMYSEKWALVKMTIFNRWGTAIYQGMEWDGNVNDSPVPTGNYVYKIECEDKGGLSSTQTGLFLLIR